MHTSFFDFLGSTFVRWWWVALFVLICLMAYEHSADNKDKEQSLLLAQLLELEAEKTKALAVHEELMGQINSQSDPEWIELTLMRVVGLCSEGQTKVVFTQP